MLAEGQRVGNYLLIRKIAAGSCGEVWLGRHHAWADKLVAIKVPGDPRYVRSLQKDGAAMHGLQHPSIVEAVDFDPCADPPYLAMEYVPGSSLRPLIQARTLSAGDAVAVLRQVLAALGHAHARSVVHRDIKPENILVHERASREGFSVAGVVKVTDFGLGRMELTSDSIAISASVSLQDARRVVGTLAYMAPEQLEGEPANARADLYACGIVLFEMLTGRKPHGVDVPSRANPSVPKHLDEVFRRSYGWVAERYASAADFSEALNEPAGRRAMQPTPAPMLAPTPAMPRPAPPPAPANYRRPPAVAPPLRAPIHSPPPLPLPADWVNGLGMHFVGIEPGTFLMGSPYGEEGRYDHEPQHEVTISRPYLMAKHHVTRGQFARFVAATHYRTDAERERHGRRYDEQTDGFADVQGASWRNPGFVQADDHPVVLVSWNDAVAFMRWLGHADGKQYHLPTEAQWELACRNNQDDTRPFNTGDTISTDQANYDGNTAYGSGATGIHRKGTTAVTTFAPNARGLHDMHGNAWQWCNDIFGPYPSDPATDPAGIPEHSDKAGTSRVVRGGSWAYDPGSCRSACRGRYAAGYRDGDVGFRVALG